MIYSQFKSQFQATEPVTLEFVELMRVTFSYYSELRTRFFTHFSSHIVQPDSRKVLLGEVKNRLFNKAYCDRLQESLKTVRRAMVRLEDMRGQAPHLPNFINDLNRLTAMAERVESLYQKHWEYYRYQAQLSDKELLDFLLDIDRIGYDWDVYLEGFAASRAIAGAIGAQPTPEGLKNLDVSFQLEASPQNTFQLLQTLLALLQGVYAFITPLKGRSAEKQPLQLLQVEMGNPVSLTLALPEDCLEPARKFLQYLFLKDQLQGATLIKFVMDALRKEYGGAALSQPVLAKMQKEILTHLEALPDEAQFSILNRQFPHDSVEVMKELLVNLESQQIKVDALIKSAEKVKKAGQMRKSAPPAEPPATPLAGHPPEPALPRQPTAAQMPLGGQPPASRDHIRVLTERDTVQS